MASFILVMLIPLFICTPPRGCDTDDLDPELREIALKFHEAREEHSRKYEELARARQSATQPVDLSALPPLPTKVVAPMFKAYINKQTSDEKAIKGIETLLGITNTIHVANEYDQLATWALEKMISDYAAHPETGRIVGLFRGGLQSVPRERVKEFYRKVIRVNRDREIVAWTKLSLGLEYYEGSSRDDSETRTKEKARGAAIIRELAKMDADTEARHRARRHVYEMDNLQIGMIAPNFEGPGADGKKIKLSQFRGQVVVIEFWGWMTDASGSRIPHDPGFAERFKGKPLTILGINSDRELSRLLKSIEEEKITWPNIHDGGQGHAIMQRWNVHSSPMIYIIDHEGVIRHRDLGGNRMEKAAEDLLRAMP